MGRAATPLGNRSGLGPSGPRRPRPLRARPEPPPGPPATRGTVTGTWTPSPSLAESFRGGFPPAPTEARWCRRPVASAIVRWTAAAVPIASSVLAAFVASLVLPAPGGGLVAAWWVAILAVSTLTLVTVDRMARRLLPLAVLLNLSMVFPDKAPDRFRVAIQAGGIRDLEQRLKEAGRRGPYDEPAKAAAEIITLVAAITAHDRRTRGHSDRVRAFNDLIAEEMRLSQPNRERLRWAALLHDVGKIRTPAAILNKPGPPTAAEWQALRRHPEEGARISAPLHPWLGPWASAIEQHHERWDGTGYPRGLTAGDISLGGRIVAVADAYEVMTSPRPYRRAMSTRAAREELARHAAGTQFDPAVVRAFLSISLGKLRRVVGPVSWLLQLPILVSVPRVEAAAAVIGRQLLFTAGTASVVGVMAVSGVVQPEPARPSLASTSTATVESSVAPAVRAGTLAGNGALPPAQPAVPVTVTSSGPQQSSQSPPGGSSGGTPARQPGRPPRKPTPVVPPIEIQVPPVPLPGLLPPVEVPPIQVPGIEIPPTGTPVDNLVPVPSP